MDQMFDDEKYSKGAVITRSSVPADSVFVGNVEDLLDDVHSPKRAAMFDAVASHYESFNRTAPSHDEMEIQMRKAILARRLSARAFSNS